MRWFKLIDNMEWTIIQNEYIKKKEKTKLGSSALYGLRNKYWNLVWEMMKKKNVYCEKMRNLSSGLMNID